MTEWLRRPRWRLVALTLAAFALGFWLRGGGPGEQATRAVVGSAPGTEAHGHDEGLFVCPMMCIQPVNKPGRCPVCGMDLMRVSGGGDQGGGGDRPRFRLSREGAEMAEIRLAPVERRPVWAEIRLYGQIEYDPAHQSVVTAYMPGVVNRVYIERAGVTVRWGQPLFDFYSSDLYFTEQELFEAAQVVPGLLDFRHAVPHTARKGEVQTRREAASRQETPAREEGDAKEAALQKMAAIRHKLRLLGLGKKDIDELMQRGEPTGIATVTAPRAGVVIRKEALEGTYVNTGTPLFTIADPRYVWLKLDAYESDLAWIRSGQEVEFQSDAVAGERFKGKVVFVDPIFNPRTRTTTVGVIAPEGEGRLRPQMIIRAVIRAEVGSEGRVLGEGGRRDRPPLVVPASAPLITGRRAVVYVLVPGEERVFEGREVVLGPRAKDHYVVREGLEEGEQVVVNGNFKIDSAAQILAKPSMMAPQDKVGGTGK